MTATSVNVPRIKDLSQFVAIVRVVLDSSLSCLFCFRPALRRMAGKRKLEEALEESEQKTQEEKKEVKEEE